MNTLKVISIGQPKDTSVNKTDGTGKAQNIWIMLAQSSTKLAVDEITGEEFTLVAPEKKAGVSAMIHDFISSNDTRTAASYLAQVKVGQRVEGTILTLPVDPHYRGEDRERVYYTSNFAFLGSEVPTEEQKQKAVARFDQAQVEHQRTADLVTA